MWVALISKVDVTIQSNLITCFHSHLVISLGNNQQFSQHFTDVQNAGINRFCMSVFDMLILL